MVSRVIPVDDFDLVIFGGTGDLARRLGLPGNSPTAAINGRSKFRMRRAFQRAGVPVPPFALVRDEETLLRACGEVGLPAVLKAFELGFI